MRRRDDSLSAAFIIVVVLFGVSVLVAWGTFWSIGVLFGYYIPLTVKTWFAWFILVTLGKFELAVTRKS